MTCVQLATNAYSVWGNSTSYNPGWPSQVTGNLTVATNLTIPVIAWRTAL